ncbi:hypothetical protein G3578_17215 [Brevibacillus sp. SYP-B805]|uniref:IucA/IucC family protein n=1 Tax=Brevibacillus sp. SYP-B805 TaxID=1578199 RepID=UPI0013EA2669|nr:IucA/IucC family protein [Brevibacillus sp. SYP-B805]NGQ96908.1 hypothetical protein [Brevibacillus sp. SYP-B805]
MPVLEGDPTVHAVRARQDILDRLFNAFLREALLPQDWSISSQAFRPEGIPHTHEDAHRKHREWILLRHDKRQFALALAVRHEGAFKRRSFAHPAWIWQNGSWTVLNKVEQCIAILREVAGVPISVEIERELLDSERNLTMAYECMEWKRRWAARQGQDGLPANKRESAANFLEWVRHMKQTGEFDELQYSESLVVSGHTLHPMTKTKLGMSPSDVRRYAPEFEQRIFLKTVLVRKERVKATLLQPTDWEKTLFADADAFLQHREALCRHYRVDPADYIPFPVHPWQYDHVLPELFQQHVQNRDLIPLPCLVDSRATLSFRTLAVTGADVHVKLPVRVRATSAIRTVSPAITVNGPLLSHVIKTLWQDERLVIVGELGGAYFSSEDSLHEEKARNLSFVVRQNPARLLRPGETALVAASLTAQSPLRERPVFVDAMEQFFGTSQLGEQHALAYIRHYAGVLLPPLVRLLQKYGIALEAHMQNTIVCLEEGAVTRFLVRDLGGARISLPRLQRHLHDQNVVDRLAGSSIFADDENELYHKFIHAVMQNHVGELIYQMSLYFDADEAGLWRAVKDVLQSSLCPSFPQYAEDCRALFQREVLTKALFTMRLQDASGSYLYTRLPNPLAVEPS